MQVAAREKLRDDLAQAREFYTTTAEQLRNLGVQKTALEAEKSVLEEEKAELQAQVNSLQQAEGGGVDVVFDDKLPREKAEDFPFFEDENLNGDEYIDEQIANLQAGVLEFNFLNYLESHHGLNVQEIVDVFKQAYLELELGELNTGAAQPSGRVEGTESGGVAGGVPRAGVAGDALPTGEALCVDVDEADGSGVGRDVPVAAVQESLFKEEGNLAGDGEEAGGVANFEALPVERDPEDAGEA